MKSHVEVAVIGGGVVGCSVLYHLTKLGCTEVALIERSELTAGSTWHAAGGMHTLNSDPNVAKLQDYTINLYQEIEEISGQSCGIHLTGGYMLAGTPERLDFLKVSRAKARYLGLDCEMATMEDVARDHPLVDPSHFIGALYDERDGHVDPSGVTNAYAKAARLAGAEIYRHNRVVELQPDGDGGWNVVTEQGTIHADKVVNAGGLWAREVGRMVGLELPVLAMEHHYLMTEPVAELEALDREVPKIIDFEAEIYTRQEGKGFLLGTYEQACVPWSPDETPWDFGHELLQPDLDRIAPSLDVAYKHFPFLADAGIKQMINGPFTFAPDGNPLVGPVPGIPNYYLACAVMAGFSQGGGVGLALSQWIVEGEPQINVFAMDCARFGDFATQGYTSDKVKENYRRRFQITFPNEELPAARPLRTTPVYERLKSEGAVFGVAYGLETPLWFSPDGPGATEEVTFRRSNAFAVVAEEASAVRASVGLMEISSFAKYDVIGPDAETWLSHMLANRMPATGRMTLSPMLSHQGRVIGDLTVAKLADEHFMIFGSGPAERYHMRWFGDHLPDTGVTITPRRADLVGLSIAGPNSRAVLAKIARADVSNQAFPFLSFRAMDLGAVPALVGRISFTGDLGYEIWVTPDYQLALYELLCQAGAEHDMRLFGSRALHSLRLEKSFGSWTREYTPDYSVFECGLDRFVDLRKNDFIGRDAVLKQREEGAKRRLVTFKIDVDDFDAIGDEPVFHDGEVVGWVSSGGYAHASKASVALGYVKTELAEATDFEIEILGVMHTAHRVDDPLFDPKGAQMRG